MPAFAVKSSTRTLFACLLATVPLACRRPDHPAPIAKTDVPVATDVPAERARTFADASVTAETMTHGRNVYVRACAVCHGIAGDGLGPAAGQLVPPPRDLRHGVIKFGSVTSGSLPTDDDLRRIVQLGLVGTSMNGNAMPREDVDAVIQYIKVFSPRWTTQRAGDPVVVSEDPWRSHPHDGLQRGEQIYHVVTMCWNCHPAYVSPFTINTYSVALTGGPIPAFRNGLDAGISVRTDFGNVVIAPDFRMQKPRAGSTLNDLFRTIAVGVGGTPMPGWRETLGDEDLWALVHYVKNLVDAGDIASANGSR